VRLAEAACARLVQDAGLASFRGLGLEGLRLLRAAEVETIEDLGRRNASELWRSMAAAAARSGERAPREALVRLWVRDARRVTGGS
jgi:hypothetical protein